MKFSLDIGPFVKSKNETMKLMHKVLIALIPIIFFAIYKNGVLPYQNGYVTAGEAFRPLWIILVSVFASVVTEALYVRFILHKKEHALYKYMIHSYAILPGLILALTLPINTPLWLVMLGSFFGSFIGKMVFGGFGFNIFNSALIGNLFIITAYSNLVALNGGYLNGMESITTNVNPLLSNLSNVKLDSLWQYLFGFMPGGIGETSNILIFLALIYLFLNKAIKWRITGSYLITVFFMATIIGMFSGFSFSYPFFQLLSGGLFFGAIFLATDFTTSPVTKTGQILYGICLGILTVVLRFLTPFYGTTITAILTMNMLVYAIDKIGVKTRFKLKELVIPLVIIGLLLVCTITYIIYDNHHNNKVYQNGVMVVYDGSR